MIYLPIGMKSKALPAKTGRPRAFDPDAALERAMHVFWAKSYEGASLSNLTRAMRINRPSLYAAFGNKEQLFRKVLDRYMNGPLAYFGKALAAPKARDVIEQIFFGAAKMAGDPMDSSRMPDGPGCAGLRRCGPICSEGNSRAPHRSQSCVASSPSTRKTGTRSPARR